MVHTDITPPAGRARRFFGKILAGCMTLLLALAFAGTASPAAAAAPQNVVVALPAYAMLFAPYLIAQEGGFYKKHGLNVSTKLVVGPASANAVIAGSADFSGGSGITALHAVAMGAPLMAIGETGNQFQMRIIVTKQALARLKVSLTAPFEERAKALKGATLAVDAINGIPDGFLRYVLGRVGLTQDDVRLTSMQPDAMLAALHANTIEGISLNAPTTTQAVAAGHLVLINDPAQEKALASLNPFAYNLLLTRNDECKKRPTVCVAMIRTLRDVEAFMAANPKKSLALLRPKFAHLDPSVLEKSFRKTVEGSNRNLMISAKSMENAQDFAVVAGILKPSQKIADLGKVYTNAYNH